MRRLARVGSALLLISFIAVACGGAVEQSPIPVNAQGFPTDWPVAVPPGSVSDCDNGSVSQEDELFSVVMCLPEDADPVVASEQYLGDLQAEGFVEREAGAFMTTQETFLVGNGIEIYFQLVGNEATIVLIKPAS